VLNQGLGGVEPDMCFHGRAKHLVIINSPLYLTMFAALIHLA
jgi:hypothetical protein